MCCIHVFKYLTIIDTYNFNLCLTPLILSFYLLYSEHDTTHCWSFNRKYITIYIFLFPILKVYLLYDIILGIFQTFAHANDIVYKLHNIVFDNIKINIVENIQVFL